MTFQSGDIVGVSQFPDEPWVVASYAPVWTIQFYPRWRCVTMRQDSFGKSHRHARIVAEGDLELVLRPVITIGSTLRYGGRPATIEAADQDDIRVAQATRKEFRGGGGFDWTWRPTVSRSDIVLENLVELLKNYLEEEQQ